MILFSDHSEELWLPGVFMISHLNSALQNQHVNKYVRPASVRSNETGSRQQAADIRATPGKPASMSYNSSHQNGRENRHAES